MCLSTKNLHKALLATDYSTLTVSHTTSVLHGKHVRWQIGLSCPERQCSSMNARSQTNLNPSHLPAAAPSPPLLALRRCPFRGKRSPPANSNKSLWEAIQHDYRDCTCFFNNSECCLRSLICCCVSLLPPLRPLLAVAADMQSSFSPTQKRTLVEFERLSVEDGDRFRQKDTDCRQ